MWFQSRSPQSTAIYSCLFRRLRRPDYAGLAQDLAQMGYHADVVVATVVTVATAALAVVDSHIPEDLRRRAVVVHTGRAGRRCSKVEAAWDSSGRRMYNWEVGLAGFGRSSGDWWWKHSTAAGDWWRRY